MDHDDLDAKQYVWPWAGTKQRSGKLFSANQIQREARRMIIRADRIITLRWKYDPEYYKVKARTDG